MNLKQFLEENKRLNRYSFGFFVKQRREELKITLTFMAQNLNVTSGYLRDIEKGCRHAPLKLLKQMMVILEITEEEKWDFVDLAYQTREEPTPDLVEYLISNKQARVAIRKIIERNISGDKLLEIVENNAKNL